MYHTQFLVVGILRWSPAYSKFQDGKIRIFDVIERVNDRLCSDLFILAKDPQLCFDQHLKDRASVDLCLSHSVSLPPISKQLTKGESKFCRINEL